MSLERGEGPEEKPPDKERIYILPPYAERDLEDMTLLIQTDGNNRAHGLNAGYDNGGKNVVNIAEHLAKRGDVSTMVACIMSADNADKRSNEFFWKMYQAVLALGLRIDIKQTLIKDRIILETYGDLDSLKKRGGPSRQFAEMVEVVCQKTSHVQDPKLKVILGINYDANIALEQNVDIIYRSGMETDNTIRLSGMRTHAGIRLIGSPTLWPHVKKDEIDDAISQSKITAHQAFHLGYKPKDIVTLVSMPMSNEISNAEITIPFAGPAKDMEKTLKQGKWEGAKLKKIDRSTSSWEITTPGNNSFRIIPGDHMLRGPVISGYDGIVAPGQNTNSFLLPHNPEANYATVHGCERSPEAIREAVRRAFIFCMKNEKLKGGERKTSSDRIVASDPEIGVARMHFQKLKNLVAKMETVPSGEIAKTIEKEFSEDDHYEADNYTLTADVFTTKLLEWARKVGSPQEKTTQFQALTNYILMSFFIPYDRESPEWESKAAMIAKYMILIYTLDEAVFDKIIEDAGTKEEKRTKIRKAKTFFQNVIRNSIFTIKPGTVEIPKGKDSELFKKLKAAWEEFIKEFTQSADQDALQSWFNSIHDFFNCSEKEFEQEKSLDYSLQNLQNPGTQEQGAAAIREKYRHRMPPLIQQKTDKLLQNGDISQPDSSSLRELKLWMYLTDIHESIGAGLVYKTAALTMDKKDITPQKITLLEEISMLSNITNRIANDLAGSLSRDLSDKENKTDACSIMTEKNGKPNENPSEIIDSMANLKKIQEEVEEEFTKKVAELKQIWPEMALLINRATIGIEIYKQNHPRKVTLKQMHGYLKEFMHFGM